MSRGCVLVDAFWLACLPDSTLIRYMEFGSIEFGYTGLHGAGLGYAGLGYAGLGYAGLGYAGFGYTGTGVAVERCESFRTCR